MTSGKVVAGPHVRKACARHLRDLVEGPARGLVWDADARDRALAYFPDVLRLNGGQFEGRRFVLHESQEFIVGSLFGWLREDGTRRFRTAYVEQGKGNGKALHVDTPIPTPWGWSTMGALAVGDEVFDEAGRVCRVLAATDVMHERPCYRLTFSDGETIVADAEHQWAVARLRTGGDGVPKGAAAVLTTQRIAATYELPKSASAHPQARWNYRVAVAGSLDLPAVDLPVPPYTLGAWLGDGDSDSPRLTVANTDRQIVDEVIAEGVTVEAGTPHSDTTGRYLLGRGWLRVALRARGILGAKSIPAPYLRASQAQRLALLQGLMDTDGSIDAITGRSEFSNMNRRLADDVVELVRSLGLKPRLSVHRAMLNGRDVGQKYRVCFHADAATPVFRLARKLARQRPPPPTRALSRSRMIVGCEPVPSEPVRCIEVDSASHLFLAGSGMIPTHNSPLAGGIGLRLLTSDGEARAEVYSAATSKDQAMILFRDAVAMVDQSPALRQRLVKTPAGDNCEHLGYPKTGSWFTALASAKRKGKSGPRPHGFLVDELHEHVDGQVVNMAAAGQKFRRQPLVFEITNSGFDRTTVCFDHHQYSLAVLAAEAPDEKDFNDAWFAYVCALDEGDEPFEDESCWIKANPLLGVTIQLDYLRKQVAEARGMPAQASTVRRLNFCEWVDAESPWISGERWRECEVEFDAIEKLKTCERVVGALDLSGTRDLTALALAGADADDNTIAKVEQWSPGDTIDERERRDRVPYRTWRDDGKMHAPPGEAIDYAFVAQRMIELQVELPHWREVAFDPYRIPYLRAALEDAGAGTSFELVNHPQGVYKAAAKKDDDGEDLPVLWMPRSIELLTLDVLKGRLMVEKNPVLTWNSASAVLEKDPKGNETFSKRKSTGRIDGIVTLAMADGLLRQDAAPEEDLDAFLNDPIIG